MGNGSSSLSGLDMRKGKIPGNQLGISSTVTVQILCIIAEKKFEGGYVAGVEGTCMKCGLSLVDPSRP